jgi:hypothetical protein
MSVDIEPLELSFQRPFNVEVSQTLTIKNPNTTPVAFKVKTTAPKQYCVRPNAGRIEPGQDFDVTVLLQAMKAEPAPDAKCRDKFLVQSASITGDKEFTSIASVLDTSDKSTIQERKIRVNWLPAASDGANGSPPVAVTPSKPSAVNGANDTPEASRTYSSPAIRVDSPSASAPPPYDDADDKGHPDDSRDIPAAVAQAASQAASTVRSAAKLTYEELQAKLSQAEAQLATLKESGLRQRKGAAETEKKPVAQLAQATAQSIQGVPVKITALLCLLAFLIAYFFF